MTINDLSDFETRLVAAKTDTDDPLATIVDVTVEHASAVPTTNERKGIVLTLQRASGATMTEWLSCPATWEPQHDLVAILCYLKIHPEELDLAALKGEELPVRYDAEEGWTLDWSIIGDADLPERRFR